MSDALERAIVARVQRGDVRVPAYPPSATKLQAVLSKEGFTMSEVVNVLRCDDVLAATALRLANSAYYSRGHEATTLSSAVVRIGSSQLHRLAVAAGTQRAFVAPGPLSSLRRRAWRQALVSAAVCETLAQAASESSEESFIGGLLHDIGRVLALAVIEELGGKVPEDEAWRLVERFHVELGMVIAARWMLPPALEEVIADHHVRDPEPKDHVLRRVQAADAVVALLEAEPSLSAERLSHVPGLSPKECQVLAAKIPTLPEFLEAFGVNAVGEPAAAAASPRAHPAAKRMVELKSNGPAVTGELKAGSPGALCVVASSPGKENWLLQVKIDDLTFWANVRQSVPQVGGGYEWHLKPFAMSPDVASRWAALTHALQEEAAAA